MQNEKLLMMPGPVPMTEQVRAAMTKQAINHRGAEFGDCYKDIVELLKPMYGTKNEIFVISGSGTAAMEAAVSNFAMGKKIVSLVNGKFGERLFELGKRYGMATAIQSEWGTPLDLEILENELREGAEVVTLVHNETSSGIKNPAKVVGKLARDYDALYIMDGITSIGGDVVESDNWGADIAIVGSQKCLAAPAGLSALSVSERAWDRLTEERPFYLDMAAYRKSASKSPMQTPYTPAVPLFFALREACRIASDEGLTNRIERHRRMANAVRVAASAWGVELFPVIDDLHSYSNTVTALKYPEGIDDTEFRSYIKKGGIEIAGGQDHLKGRIFRIGSMGATGAPEMLATIAAVQHAFRHFGFRPEGDGVSAAAEVLE